VRTCATFPSWAAIPRNERSGRYPDQVHHLAASSVVSPMMSYWDSFAPVRT